MKHINNKNRNNSAKGRIADRCCHLENDKSSLLVSRKQLHVLVGGLTPKLLCLVVYLPVNVYSPDVSTHFSVAWSVCLSVCRLSVVCHIRATCLNRSTDLDAIWPIHLWGPMTHRDRWGSWTSRKGEDLGVEPPSQNMQLQTAAKLSVLCCHLANTNEELGGLASAILPFDKLLWSLLHKDIKTIAVCAPHIVACECNAIYNTQSTETPMCCSIDIRKEQRGIVLNSV